MQLVAIPALSLAVKSKWTHDQERNPMASPDKFSFYRGEPVALDSRFA
jgi:hypothetical protein